MIWESVRSARVRSALVKVELRKWASRRSDPTRIAPVKLAFMKRAPCSLRPESSHLAQSPPKVLDLGTSLSWSDEWAQAAAGAARASATKAIRMYGVVLATRKL